MKVLKKILIGILVLFVLIQFYRKDYGNKEFDANNDFISLTNPPTEVKEMLTNACYDCHSNQVKYPWYSQVAPISWWTINHVNEGREHLNFSEWGNYDSDQKKKKLIEAMEEIVERKMPLESYTKMHEEAILSKEQSDKLVDFLNGVYKSN